MDETQLGNNGSFDFKLLRREKKRNVECTHRVALRIPTILPTKWFLSHCVEKHKSSRENYWIHYYLNVCCCFWYFLLCTYIKWYFFCMHRKCMSIKCNWKFSCYFFPNRFNNHHFFQLFISTSHMCFINLILCFAVFQIAFPSLECHININKCNSFGYDIKFFAI